MGHPQYQPFKALNKNTLIKLVREQNLKKTSRNLTNPKTENLKRMPASRPPITPAFRFPALHRPPPWGWILAGRPHEIHIDSSTAGGGGAHAPFTASLAGAGALLATSSPELACRESLQAPRIAKEMCVRISSMYTDQEDMNSCISMHGANTNRAKC